MKKPIFEVIRITPEMITSSTCPDDALCNPDCSSVCPNNCNAVCVGACTGID